MASLAHAGFPVITTIPAQTVLEDSATLAVELNITDPDNEPLTIGTSISDTDLATLQIIGTWTQVGQDMDGEAAEDYSGSVSLSADATTVAIGAFGNDGNGKEDSGHVRIYTNNGGAWTQLGQDIDGEAAGDGSGESVSLSADGATVAIGARWNDGNGENSGHVRIYNVKDFLLITPKENVNGTATVTITATDTADNETSSTFTLNVDIDTDGDGVGNNADTDDDGDNYLDADEIAAGTDPLNSTSVPLDTDGDFISNVTDTDDDNDGISDTDEIDMGTDPIDESDCITCGPKSWWRFKLM